MTIELLVEAEEEVGGYVREARLADDSPLTSEPSAECVIETILSLELVPPDAGGKVFIRYPLTFARSD